MKRLFSTLCLLLCTSLPALEWTSADGRKLQAEMVSATGTTVKLKLPNGQFTTLPLTRLSPEGMAWVQESALPHPSTKKAVVGNHRSLFRAGARKA